MNDASVIESLGQARTRTERLASTVVDGVGDEADGYHLQWRLHGWLRAQGWGRHIGWKIGATTAVMQELLGIDHACAGGVLAGRAFAGSAELRFADLIKPGIECEIAVRLGAGIPASAAPFDAAGIRPYVATAMAAMELVDDRYDDSAAGRWRDWSPTTSSRAPPCSPCVSEGVPPLVARSAGVVFVVVRGVRLVLVPGLFARLLRHPPRHVEHTTNKAEESATSLKTPHRRGRAFARHPRSTSGGAIAFPFYAFKHSVPFHVVAVPPAIRELYQPPASTALHAPV